MAEDDAALLDATLARRRNFPVILPIFVRPSADSETAPEAVAPLPRFARSVDLVAVQTAPRGGAPTREWRDLWSVDGERTVSVIDPHRQLRDGQPVLIDFSIAPSSFVRVSYLDVFEGRVPASVRRPAGICRTDHAGASRNSVSSGSSGKCPARKCRRSRLKPSTPASCAPRVRGSHSAC